MTITPVFGKAYRIKVAGPSGGEYDAIYLKGATHSTYNEPTWYYTTGEEGNSLTMSTGPVEVIAPLLAPSPPTIPGVLRAAAAACAGDFATAVKLEALAADVEARERKDRRRQEAIDLIECAIPDGIPTGNWVPALARGLVDEFPEIIRALVPENTDGGDR